ncbi:sigma-54-dependent Fis family transcriptional regulator [Phosphitispora sp. TUW77]|uniref:sigma-54-dependent Fis family transcriptional regulator n=1 Tax=Phosphitispora sp. TUW77 TaxID=3152361 RepID=UPI003AB80A74
MHDRKEQLLNAWTAFVDKGIVNENCVRKEIADSWRRCRALNVDPTGDVLKFLSKAELEVRREAKRELLDISFPIMKNLFSFVEGSGFFVSLCDQDGVVIETLVDQKANCLLSGHRFMGCVHSEENVGTSAVALALELGHSIQVFASEHYKKVNHPWTASAGPIYGHSQEMIGILSIAGSFENVHSHTLGMVVAAVNAIEGQLKINKVLEDLKVINEKMQVDSHYQNAIVDSISEGLIAIDEKGRITKINATAATMLKVNAEAVLYSSINELMGYHDPISRSLQSGDIVNDVQCQAEIGKGKTHCTITCRPIRNPDKKIVGLVAIIREIKAVKHLVHQMVGAKARFVFDDLIGRNASYLKTIKLARCAADSSSNVLLLGESGTGKEIFAQAIHNASDRTKGPFIAINCGAIPRELVGSEMFGYSDGAFTGAKRGGNPGKFELAEGGTIFLDEIGEMPIELQAHLLRVLQEKVVTRLGSTQVIPVDVRVIAATSKDLHQEVIKGGFRKDLYYRLNVLTINMIPLRNRPDDILALTRFFIEKINHRLGQQTNVIHPEAIDILQRYNWPGNIRELENVLERAIHVATGETLTVDCLPEEIKFSSCTQHTSTVPLPQQLPDDEVVITRHWKDPGKAIIIEAIKRNEGNLTRTAKDLRIARSTLYSKLKKYCIRINTEDSISTEIQNPIQNTG